MDYENDKKNGTRHRFLDSLKSTSKVVPSVLIQRLRYVITIVGVLFVISVVVTLVLAQEEQKHQAKEKQQQTVIGGVSGEQTLKDALSRIQLERKRLLAEEEIKIPTIVPKLDAHPRSERLLPPKKFKASTFTEEDLKRFSAPTTVIKNTTSPSNTVTGNTSGFETRVARSINTVASGELIRATLETAVNSDLPGMVRALVTRPVYAYTGDNLIIPAGSRLTGQYNSGIVMGQERVMVVWERVLLPNGVAVQIESPGADHLGRSGMSASRLDTHFFKRFGTASLLSLIGASVASTGGRTDDNLNVREQYRLAVAQSFQQTANASLQQSLQIKPTVHVHQGEPIQVFVAQDLSFYEALNATSC